MVEKDVEMEDTGKLLEDEVLSGQENVEKKQLVVEEVGGEQDNSYGLVKEEIQNPNEVAEEEKMLSGNAEEETHPDQTEQELPMDETHYGEEDATALEDDDTRDNGKDATALEDDNTHGNGKDATALEDHNIHDNEKDATTIDDDKTRDIKKDAASMDGDNTPDNEKDATAKDDDKTHDIEKGAVAVDNDNGVQGDTDGDAFMKMPGDKCEGDDTIHEKHKELATPTKCPRTCSASKAEDHSAEMPTKELEDTKMDEGYESGTPEDQAAFMKELETFHKEKSLEFKPPKFYGQPLNCLKLWRSVIKLGGYDPVTGSKLWRQIGESFHPPKTCTTVSWTFRNFYEKALLEYERHKMHSGELELPLAVVHLEASTVENEANGNQVPGSGRARRDAAARAMQGWHVQRSLGYGEVSEPIIKDKNPNNSQKRERSLKSIGLLKHKRPSEVEHSAKAARTETSRQLRLKFSCDMFMVVTMVADVGPPADWVKVNVQETKDSFEIYALVPGLLREKVCVQSDPAGRVVIIGQLEQPDNPWGITAYKKVINLPSRIDPLRTSAIVSLHGRLLVRVPFEHSII